MLTKKPEYRKFIPEQELIESYNRQGKPIPPWIVFQPFVIREGVSGYMVPCKPSEPGAELWDAEKSDYI